MAVNGIVGAKYLLTRIGNSYKEEDCVHAVVINLIRNCAGGDKSYRTAGCTELWKSINKSGKYRHITKCMTISEAKQSGLLIGDLPVIYNSGTGICEHIAYYMGGIGGYECIHSSKSKGCVCGTTLANGFTHVLRHRDITGVNADATTQDTEKLPEQEREERDMDVLYYAKVSTKGGALNLRRNPEMGQNIICEIPYGTELPVIKNDHPEWTMVSYNGTTGYVSSGYLTYSHNAPSKEEAADDPDIQDDVEAMEEDTSMFGGTWGVFIPCSGKIAANLAVGYFNNGQVIKVNLGD